MLFSDGYNLTCSNKAEVEYEGDFRRKHILSK